MPSLLPHPSKMTSVQIWHLKHVFKVYYYWRHNVPYTSKCAEVSRCWCNICNNKIMDIDNPIRKSRHSSRKCFAWPWKMVSSISISPWISEILNCMSNIRENHLHSRAWWIIKIWKPLIESIGNVSSINCGVPLTFEPAVMYPDANIQM